MKEYPKKSTRYNKKAEYDTENANRTFASLANEEKTTFFSSEDFVSDRTSDQNLSDKVKKNRFQISREVQEEFVNSVAENMLTLANGAGKWQKPWQSENPLEMPFCPTTGREYGGSNMVKLLLTNIIKGYDDNRWVTFKQLQEYQGATETDMQIRKGEKGVKLLRPEEIRFTVNEDDGRWEYLNDKQIKALEEQKEQGLDVPEVQRMTLFYPFTVFNAAQIEGFPAKEHQSPMMNDFERNKFVEDFIASSGVEVKHHNGDAYYEQQEDIVKMPYPKNFNSSDEYYAAKLHEFYHATGHEQRENRKNKLLDDTNIKDYAFEELRAEMFSMLVGVRFNLPMPEQNSAAYIEHWNNKFSGGDAKAVFRATSEAAKILSLMWTSLDLIVQLPLQKKGNSVLMEI